MMGYNAAEVFSGYELAKEVLRPVLLRLFKGSVSD